MPRRYTSDEKSAFLVAFDQQSSNAAVYCREHELSYQTFLSWRRKATRTAAPPAFIEVAPVTAVERAAPDPGPFIPFAELAIPGGIVLRIYASPNP